MILVGGRGLWAVWFVDVSVWWCLFSNVHFQFGLSLGLCLFMCRQAVYFYTVCVLAILDLLCTYIKHRYRISSISFRPRTGCIVFAASVTMSELILALE